ncbi:LacI family DNA-binding transcriptional regulator [Oceaniglobus trochenteri]|uniref:LacI family DNA-binding transcriptional regulator n=1 Tax=Oceaniglobus trochenteri TaxID=2763260 RepID=UPI001CFFC299|nr:LacI family DNA-binding transcriptional regulator [Oceaniglobus trochenteri]
MKPRVSIKQVAAKAGVSAATVSLVLNDKGRISEQTQRKVRKAAQSLGFILNKSASRLRSGRSLLIGLVVNDISNPFFAELSSDVETIAAEKGYLSVMANTRDDIERQHAVIETMIGQGVAGLIISAASGSDDRSFKLIRDHGIPYVLCVREIKDYAADFIGFDNHQAGVIAAEHLIAQGYRNIAFIGGMEHNENRRRRFEGVSDALTRHRLTMPESWALSGPATREFGAQAATALLSHHREIEALACFNDYVALGAYEGINNARLTIGRDIGVIGFDNVPESASWMPPLTTVELFPRAIGRRAAKALLTAIDSPDEAPERVFLAPTLMRRKSC